MVRLPRLILSPPRAIVTGSAYNKNQDMKQQLSRITLMVLVLCGVLVLGSALQPQSASAQPGLYFAAARSCDLPDGSDNGALGKDGKTCCPVKDPNSPDADPTAFNAINCLYAKYVNPIIALLSALVGIAVVIAIIYGAIEYTTSGGDPQRIASGKKHIIEALIGLVAFMLLYSFMQFLVPGGLFSQ